MKPKLLVTVTFIAMLIAACGAPSTQAQEPTADVAAIRTSAASTVISEFTLTAAAFTATPSLPTDTDTPVPEVTGTATVPPVAQVTGTAGTSVALCDSLAFVADVNVPDGTNMSPGQDFLKTWRVKNTGSCTWDANYKLIYAGYADKMAGQWQPLTQVVQPGQEVELSVQFKAPDQIGEYLSAWQMANSKGVTMPEAIYVKVIVQ
ncbi:MAG TPA: NBR1-Ig-like domain-containing protein [Anaerolineales bacterium]|nr:NBR1-Ig-like domain-containing protein [Anaerolineales bacterium]